jgi:hypothetical protein
VGQSKTGDTTRFTPVSLEAALLARHDAADRLATAINSITS